MKSWTVRYNFRCNASGLETQCEQCDGTGDVTCPICGGCGQADDYEKQDVVQSVCYTNELGECVEELGKV